MIVKNIPNSWLQTDGRRLDCGPYMSGALEAKILLAKLSARKDPLSSLTTGYKGGIFNGPQFRRNYVTSPEHGVPFLTGGDVLTADLSRLPLLSRRDATSSKLSYLRLSPGSTIISCSGAIGRTNYVRYDMRSIWLSQDVLKVVPDPKKIPPGYLFAYLTSKFGVPMITSGTYGAIIQHIEAEHIANLPVPRLGTDYEKSVHSEIERASLLRAESQTLIHDATNLLLRKAGLTDYTPYSWHAQGRELGFSSYPGRGHILRALSYSPRYLTNIRKLESVRSRPLGDICANGYLGTGKRFKRVDCSPEYGVRLVGQREGFSSKPDGRWISARHAPKDIFAAEETVLIASSGTLGETEVYCRPLLVSGSWSSFVYTQHFFRVISGDSRVPGPYLFAFLRSELAFRCLRSMSTGSKQQEIHPLLISKFPIPILGQPEIDQISGMVREAFSKRDLADSIEQQAVDSIDKRIEGLH